ncbi:hypothetical protein [Yinghuangia sp. YIM S09857]|uniref:hypothetical protein n=1 Tax=Yinghuangia sp. YIM S09857 TaxID=3436929 RepID=UPI003F537EE9
MTRTTFTRRLAIVTAASVLALLTACSGGGGKKDAPAAGDGGFAPAPGTAACQEHQANEPGVEYTSEEEGDTGKVFEMLRHYTANGRKPFCDGKPPTDLDKRWAGLFLGFGADAGLLAPELGGSGQAPEEPMEEPMEEPVEAPEADLAGTAP